MATEESVPMTHYPSATTSFSPPLIAHTNHYLGDLLSSDKNDSEKPISCGLYKFTPGEELEYAYHYHEMKIILEGGGTITDGTGKAVSAKKGDVFYFPKGSVIRFKTSEEEGGCLAFYCGQRKEGSA